MKKENIQTEITNGLFITLRDDSTLHLYLKHGVYGQIMNYYAKKPPYQSNHYAILGDFACTRPGTHIFFFLKRKIYYGGQVTGRTDQNTGTFIINGSNSPLGQKNQSQLVWDESERECYEKIIGKSGIFKLNKEESDTQKRCHPYLIKFVDKQGLNDKYVTSDDFYFKLGEFGYPLPSNSISGMGFCTMSPGEVRILLGLLKRGEDFDVNSQEKIKFINSATYFQPHMGLSDMSEADYESELEAFILADPRILPKAVKGKVFSEKTVFCRQFPICPYKPARHLDKVDIVGFTQKQLKDGTMPNFLIEIKKGKAGKADAKQIIRYSKWIQKVAPEEFTQIEFILLAKSFTNNFDRHLPDNLPNLKKISFEDI